VEKLIEITQIKVGKRARQKPGDIDALAQSIAEHGLLHAVVVNQQHQLIAGWRRLQACKRLGHEQIRVFVASEIDDARQMLLAERDENSCRESLAPSEAVALGLAIERLERPNAKRRQAEQARRNQPQSEGGKFPPLEKAKTRDNVGAAIGMSGRSYEKAKAVVQAAKENPAQFADLRREMDDTGNVDRAYRELRQRRDPVAKRKPRYPVSDKFCRITRELAGLLEELRQEYRSLPKMLSSRDWDPAETVWARQFVESFAKTFAEMHKELESALKETA
jgi:ParB family chromosome partitioning protein